MKELKMGDEVEIYGNDEWEKRIFVKKGQCNGIICVHSETEGMFKNDKSFHTTWWKKWRIPEEKKYRPFTFEDRELFLGRWVKNKNNNTEIALNIISLTTVENCDYEFLLSNYTFLDGSPCGKEVTE